MIVDKGNFNVGEADELQDMQAEIYQQKQPNIQQEVFHTRYFATMYTGQSMYRKVERMRGRVPRI